MHRNHSLLTFSSQIPTQDLIQKDVDKHKTSILQKEPTHTCEYDNLMGKQNRWYKQERQIRVNPLPTRTPSWKERQRSSSWQHKTRMVDAKDHRWFFSRLGAHRPGYHHVNEDFAAEFHIAAYQNHIPRSSFPPSVLLHLLQNGC